MTTATETFVGRVKWFNNKAGTGFITITDGEKSGSDIFVHHSAIITENKQFLYLVQGEYVEFALIPAHKGTSQDNTRTYEFQAGNVRGIKGGKLMCETRRDIKISRGDYNTTKRSDNVEEFAQPKTPRQKVPMESSQEPVSKPRKTTTPRVRGEGPRDGDKKQWTLVGKDNTKQTQPGKKNSNRSQTIKTD